MRRKSILIVGGTVAGVILLIGVLGIARRAQKPIASDNSSSVLSQRATPADRQIVAAQGIIERAPKLSYGYNLLANAYMQKARETADLGYYKRAEDVAKRSFEIEPNNHGATKIQSFVLLAYHRFGEALEVARRSVQQDPTDYEAHGALVDALVELGKYDEAKQAVQTMLDVRPYTGSYARASYLRSLYGKTDGAIEAMRLAVQSANPADPESIAWCLVHLGDELANAGRLKEAELEYDKALFSFPDYHLALAAKGRARFSAGDTDKALEFYKRAQDQVPSPDTVIALGDLYAKLGRSEDAKRQYDLVEFIERSGNTAGTYSRELALFYADHDIKLDDALTIARRERAARSDIFTNDVLAWCLYKKGELAEAKTEIDAALRLGTRDARMLYHAGMIYKALGDNRNAGKYLREALAINPSFDVLQADIAKETVRALKA